MGKTKASDKPMTEREEKILATMKRFGRPVTIREMAREAFASVRPVERADTAVRNSLRRHRDEKAIKQVARGTYQLR